MKADKIKEKLIKEIGKCEFIPMEIILSSKNEYIGFSIKEIPILYDDNLPKDEYLIKS